jgi:hypothetical protein
MSQEAHLRCRLQEPSDRFAGTIAQRRLTKRSRETRLGEVPVGVKVRIGPVQKAQGRRRCGRTRVVIIGFLCRDLAGSWFWRT